MEPTPMKIDLSQIPVFKMMMSNTSAEDTEVFDPALFDTLYKSLGGIEKNSLTTSPAVRLKAVIQSSGLKPLQLKKNTDVSKRLITGVKMVPNMLLFKTDDAGVPYADVYTKEVIYHSRNKFMMGGNIHAIDWEHTGPNLSDVFLVESWIVEDPTNDKLNALGFTEQFKALGYSQIPVGTMAVTYFVPNDKLWDEIVSNPEGYGFSIMGYYASTIESSSQTDKLLAQALSLSHRDDLTTAQKLTELVTMLKG